MPGLFDPITIRGVTLENRIMLSPMCQYLSDETGTVNMWHKVHYGSRIISRPGLIMIEATSVEPRGRLSSGDLGIWDDQHVDGLKEIVDFAHQHKTKIAIQLAHAGRKAMKDFDLVSASSIEFKDGDKVPREINLDEIESIIEHFIEAAKRAKKAGFDIIEIHGAHGYLINQFLSPISNHRKDRFGGNLKNRCQFARKIIRGVRNVVGDDMPIFFRISATEYSSEGLAVEDMKDICRILIDEGVDVIDVSTGGNLHHPVRSWPGYQVDYATEIRKSVDIPVIAVGKIVNGPMAEEIIRNNRADMVAVGRAFLKDPYWPHTAAKELGLEVEHPYFS